MVRINKDKIEIVITCESKFELTSYQEAISRLLESAVYYDKKSRGIPGGVELQRHFYEMDYEAMNEIHKVKDEV